MDAIRRFLIAGIPTPLKPLQNIANPETNLLGVGAIVPARLRDPSHHHLLVITPIAAASVLVDGLRVVAVSALKIATADDTTPGVREVLLGNERRNGLSVQMAGVVPRGLRHCGGVIKAVGRGVKTIEI